MKKKQKSPGLTAAFRAMREAVNEVIITHEKLGLPLWVEQNGKIVSIKANSRKMHTSKVSS